MAALLLQRSSLWCHDNGSIISGVHVSCLWRSTTPNSGFPHPRRDIQLGLTVWDFPKVAWISRLGRNSVRMEWLPIQSVRAWGRPLSFSTHILTFHLLTYLYLPPTPSPPTSFSHSHSSNQITSFTSSFPFPSFSNCRFPTTTYCPVYIRIEFNMLMISG